MSNRANSSKQESVKDKRSFATIQSCWFRGCNVIFCNPEQSQKKKYFRQEPTVVTQQTALKHLFSRLNQAGFKSSFAQNILPSWWDNSIAKTPSGLQLAHLYFARAFNLDLVSVCAPDQAIQFLNAERKFKLSKNISASDVVTSANFATAIAKLAMQQYPKQLLDVPSDPAALRATLLQTNECVSLQALLNWCTKAGIPVLHIESLPGKKMTGLVVREDNRFAIVLSKKNTPSHQLFYLAHELGHIAKGHLKSNGFVADEKISGSDAGDADEKEADAYAIRLINGKEVAYSSSSTFRSGAQLFKAASSAAKQAQVDVGHIILNYAKTKNTFAVAMIALRSISGETEGATTINSAFFNALDESAFSEDQLELLIKATGFKASV